MQEGGPNEESGVDMSGVVGQDGMDHMECAPDQMIQEDIDDEDEMDGDDDQDDDDDQEEEEEGD